MNSVQTRFRYTIALRSVVIYLVLSILWIVLSDLLLNQLSLSLELKGKIEVWKGLIFVLLSTLMLYFLVLSAAKEQKQILDELSKSEIKFRSTLDSMFEGCQIIGFDWRYIYLNDAAATHGRKQKAELLGRTVMEAYPGIEQTTLYRGMKGCLETRSVSEFENEFTYPDGTTAWFELRIQPVHEGIFILSIDITQRKHAQEEVRKSREQLLALTTHLQSSIESERSRISHEIHDDIGQRMTAIRMDLSLLQKSLGESTDPIIHEVTTNEIPEMQRMIDDSIQTMRKIIRDLRPEVLDALGLEDGMRWQADEFQRRTGIPCTVTLPEQRLTFTPDASTALFRILQEGLNNVIRHAQATAVNVALIFNEGMLVLEITDNGKGISEAEKNKVDSFGLLGIRERARTIGGAMTITGKQGEGTILRVSIPCIVSEDGGLRA